MAHDDERHSDMTWAQIWSLAKKIADTPNVRRSSRVASLLLLPALGGVATYFIAIEHRVAVIELDRKARIEEDDKNTKVLNNTVNTMQSQISSLTLDVSDVKLDVATVKLDVATVKGILQDMQQKQHEVALISPPRPFAN